MSLPPTTILFSNMPAKDLIFPLRWESTADQWWFASPIDYAAANGHYDTVRSLLHIDTNLLIKLTSLPRIRRLETVWDDTHDHVAKNRSDVARQLLRDCDSSKNNGGGQNSLIRCGYGGWLLYTAASAGDVGFVKELLERDRLLVFGEGEYGVTDMLYAAARSRNGEVFRVLLECAVAAKGEVIRKEVMNRAVHAAARGGDVEMVRELLLRVGDVLDVRGSTVLHTAAGRGQVEVVKYLVSSHDNIISSIDNRGNTALHVAAYRGHSPAVQLLISASPSSASTTNNHGNTFLHMAISGFRNPSFRRIDRQLDLIKQFINGNLTNIADIINLKNNEGRTALHTAIVENVQTGVVELLMSAPYINLNIRDNDGNTPLDLLKKRPRSASSEIRIKRFVSFGGIPDSTTDVHALASHLRMHHGIGGSPGTSFRIPDAEILLYTGVEDIANSSSCDLTSTEYGYSGEIERVGLSNSPKFKKLGSINSATRRLKNILRWPGKKDNTAGLEEDKYSIGSSGMRSSLKDSPVPLRQQFSRMSSLPNNKRIMSLRGGGPGLLPSPSSKKKFARGLSHGVLQVPKSAVSNDWSSSWSSPDGMKGHNRSDSGSVGSTSSQKVERGRMSRKYGSFNMRLMNSYLCFGAQGVAVENTVDYPGERQNGQSIVV